MISYLAALALAATSAQAATSLFFPLYVYPSKDYLDGCTYWTDLFTQISAQPETHFTLVINPASGPGDANTQPDDNMQQCVPKLYESGSNVEVVGYVSTDYGNRATDAVKADIATYAQWAEDYRPTGIFFDEAASGSAQVSLYADYASTAKSSLGGTVVFNPGTVVEDNAYYESADLVVSAEYAYSNFDVNSSLTISDSAPASKQVVILYAGPSSVDTALISGLKDKGIGGVFVTDYSQADAYSYLPTDFDGLVAAIAA